MGGEITQIGDITRVIEIARVADITRGVEIARVEKIISAEPTILAPWQKFCLKSISD